MGIFLKTETIKSESFNMIKKWRNSEFDAPEVAFRRRSRSSWKKKNSLSLWKQEQ